MSSDGYFDSDLDNSALEAIDAIEVAALNSPTSSPQRNSLKPSRPGLPQKETSFYDLTFDFDEDALVKIDNITEDAYQGKVAGPSKAKYQTTLFGDILPPQPTKPTSQVSRVKSSSSKDVSAQSQPSKKKEWDHTQFAKSGTKRAKGKARFAETDEFEADGIEFEQFPAPFVSVGPPPPMKLKADLLETKHWIYPLNRPKRDYQFNIVKRCLFDNTIVALPTGLGKTFIAGVVMLNYYRWFPDGKVVFVAPTKPLVAQQIEACHQVCGIPGSDAAELTGAIQRLQRARAWTEKRVFYMTPQTLINDLNTQTCDARDIVLLVVDEAHRGTGDYAYNHIVRYLMSKNPHHRVLALTATPGSNPDAVQRLVDGLHISRIEIRNEDSLDIKPFIHNKTISQHIVNMNDEVVRIRDMLSKVINAEMRPLKSAGIIWPSADPAKFHPYAAMARMRDLRPDQRWGYAALSRLASLARAMGYLIEGSIGMCYTYLQDLAKDDEGASSPTKGEKGATKGKKKLKNDPGFQEVVQELKDMAPLFPTHPKMDLMKTLLVQYFGQALRDEGEEEPISTRVMVFSTFREAVDEIIAFLESEKPLIKATKFIGQGTDKQGKKGMTQKEQLEIIERFKAGEFNVLVATAIGEEGLDIGEVDMIVCYDAQKTPIRMLQRLGRTGRKRAGYVHVLLAEGREELNLDKAKDAYKEIQKTIIRGDQLELYTDVPRLLPDHVKPEVLEQQMEIQEYVRETGSKRAPTSGVTLSTVGKRKRNDHVMRNIPNGASTGFVPVSELLVKGGSKKRKAVFKKGFDEAGEDDDVDLDLQSGSLLAPRRTKSAPAKETKERSKLRRTKTNASKSSEKHKVREPTSSQFSNRGNDDSHDEDIGLETILPRKSKTLVTLDDSPSPCRSPRSLAGSPQPGENIAIQEATADMSWLVDEDEDAVIDIVDSSPLNTRPAISSSNCDSNGVKRWSQTDNELDVYDMDDPPLRSPSRHRSIEMQGVPNTPDFASPELSQDIPTTTFPVKRDSKRRQLVLDSPDFEMGSPKRLRRHHSQVRSRRNVKQRVHIDPDNPMYDLAAIHSGDEVSEGSSGEEEECSSDREFLRPLPETQASPSYNQTQAYRQSLLTQASGGPTFTRGPLRRGDFGVIQRTQVKRRPQLSSPLRDEGALDQYEFDSFVVDDDAEISYLSEDDINTGL